MRSLITLVLAIALAIAAVVVWQVYVPVTPPTNTSLLLHSGYSTRRIAAELKRRGVIRSELAFEAWHALHRKRSLKAGEYFFDHPATLGQVHDRIARGDVSLHLVTIPEGYTIFDIAKTMQESGLASAEDFLRVARTRTDLIADIAPEAKSLEGYLFPSTYQFTRTQTLDEMVTAMVHQFRQVAQQVGLIPAPPSSSQLLIPDLNGKRPPSYIHQIVTMASIVEKETAVSEERPLVASVYYNRLKQRMALDADPGIIYAELLSGSYGGSLHHADLAVNSPYNTYRFPGLPPGPIGNPGQSSLEAALHPAQTQFLYFVADGNGHHRFARSLEEHNRNVVAYRHSLGLR